MSSLDCRQALPSAPDNFSIVIPIEDELKHTDEYPFCFDETCYCPEDEEAIAVVFQAVLDGLISADEATDFVLGRLL